LSVRLSAEARRVLAEGTFCSIAARTPRGLHLTPVVYVAGGDRIWMTTSRASVKARAWREDPATAGLVVHDRLAVTFRGRVRAFDLLDPKTWGPSALRSLAITRAAARFSMKNARFFAGYARDAHRVPLSWTPPARVFASVELDAAALLDLGAGTVVERWGEWPDAAPAVSPSRRTGGRGDPLAGLPADVRRAVGDQGEGAVGLGLAVLPCRWRTAPEALEVAVAVPHLRLCGSNVGDGGAVQGQRPSAWRAREMRGFLAQGPVRVGKGGRLRLAPERLVWWRGWAAGTVAR
jgi:hypothetical protein